MMQITTYIQTMYEQQVKPTIFMANSLQCSFDKVHDLKSNIRKSGNILNELQAIENGSVLQCSKMQELEVNKKQLQNFYQHDIHVKSYCQEDLAMEILEEEKDFHHYLLQQFTQTMTDNLYQILSLQEQVTMEIEEWKREIQRVVVTCTVYKEQIDKCNDFWGWLTQLKKLNEKIFTQLKQVKCILQKNVMMKTDCFSELAFIESCIAEVFRLRQELISRFVLVKKLAPKSTVSVLDPIHQKILCRKVYVEEGMKIINEFQLKKESLVFPSLLQQTVRDFQVLFKTFQHHVEENLDNLVSLQTQVAVKIRHWKYEQQQMANNESRMINHSVSLKTLKVWCEELVDLIWNLYEQLTQVKRIQQEWGNMPLPKNIISAPQKDFIQNRTDQVCKMLHQLLNQSLIVEQQPPQVIKTQINFPKPVVVSWLAGKRIFMGDLLEMTVHIITEKQAQSLPETDKLETAGEINNGSVIIDNRKWKDDNRNTFAFSSLQLNRIKRKDQLLCTKCLVNVSEGKHCLYFECTVKLRSLTFKISTISLPMVVITQSSQEAMANATILWDNAFGESDRVPFQVPLTVSWNEVADRILNSRFIELTGRGLSENNLAYLTRKVSSQPQPEMITWTKFCKQNLPEREFTFWDWFHATLNLFNGEKTYLHDLWKRGFIMGFIEKEAAETLLLGCEIGTFLLRFSESLPGSISLACKASSETVIHLYPWVQELLQERKMIKTIQENSTVRFLYQPNGSIPKHEAFKSFYICR